MVSPAMRLLIVGFTLHLLIGCTETDDRPQTLAYITETILAPNCASAQCHSDLKRQNGYVFDTVAHAQESLADRDMSRTYGGPIIIPGDTSMSYLLQVISKQDNLGNRMPIDQPLDNKDNDLIGSWIRNGAVGYVAP